MIQKQGYNTVHDTENRIEPAFVEPGMLTAKLGLRKVNNPRFQSKSNVLTR